MSTSDTPVKKTLLRLIRDALQWVLHILLIPVVALIKGLAAMFSYLHDELAKI